MTDVDDVIAELENASTPLETPDGVELPNADPDSDDAPKEDKRKRPWSSERRERHREAQRKRREREASGTATPRRRRSSTKLAQELGSGLTKAFTVIGTLVSTKDPYAGSVIMRRSDALGEAWGKLAAQNPKIARYLDLAQKTGVYGEVAFVTASVVLPIMAHKGMFPPFITAQIIGAFDPESAMMEQTSSPKEAPYPEPNSTTANSMPNAFPY